MKKKPILISGNVYNDDRGSLFYNNDFDASIIKRIYFIENATTLINRGWQGHKIEQRWFSSVTGSFKISILEIDNWEKPSKDLIPKEFILNSSTLDILHIPKGYITSIKALKEESKLLVLADYLLGEIKDEYKFPQNYFEHL
ncbi:WxcM-like domain-containing protein [Polaribacter sp. MSW13]|uniref:WxcM-like domain-containing protein n=1 Tax=Polaribacter marinus TaxID=2916838 RepID=A0A9X1VN96_9FLAO|nr:WxcM-like domain-containing protein [Polaribacter marinus]MCI2227545.1 WxcM-like domain-containing protein [Polaribacter marinus]